MAKITVEEIDIIVQAYVEDAMKDFKKLVPQIKNTIAEAQKEINKVDMEAISKEVNQTVEAIKKPVEKAKKEVQEFTKSSQKYMGNYSKSVQSTSKQEELLIYQIEKRKKLLEEAITPDMSEAEAGAKYKEVKKTGKEPQIMNTEQILKVEAEIEKLENKLVKLQNKEVKIPVKIENENGEIEDHIIGDVSGMKIQANGYNLNPQVIKGYSNEVLKLRGNISQLYNEETKLSNVTLNQNAVEQMTNKIQEAKPQIQQAADEVSNALGNVDTTSFKEKIQSAIESIKQKLQSLRGEGTEFNFTGSEKQLELVKYKISEIQEKLQQAKDGTIHMNTQEIVQAEAELEKLNNQKAKLENQSGGGSFFISLVSKIKNAGSYLKQNTKLTSSWKNGFNQVNKVTANVSTKIKQMGSQMKSGLKQVLKYAMALFSLRSIYTALSSSASSWLSSQNAQAQQLSANIDYMKYAMGSAFAPIIEYVLNLVYKLMKAIQSVIYALTKVNIFANASASSYASMASSASDAADSTKEASKSLTGVHDEINNVNSSSSGSGSSGSGSSSPSFDLSGVDTELSGLSEKLYNFFKPLIDSWNTYGAELIEQLKTTASQVVGMLSAVWSSFENVITNGTVYTTLELILAIIGNIAEAFTIAWTNASIGDQIVQNFFDTFNLILSIINQIAQSTGFQNMLSSVLNVLNTIILTIQNIATAFANAFVYNGNLDTILTNLGTMLENIFNAIKKVTESADFQDFLDFCSDKLTNISEKLAGIDWQPMINALTSIGEVVGEIALTILDGLVTVFTWFVEHPTVAEIILGIAAAITAVYEIMKIVTALQKNEALQSMITMIAKAWEHVTALLAEAAAWVVANAGILLVIAAIAAVIAIIALVITHWDEIKETVSNVVEAIKEKVSEWVENVKTTITNFIENIKTKWTDFWNGIKDKASEIWDNIKTTVSNAIENVKTTISNVINSIKTTWSTIWTAIKTTISSIWEGIKTVVSNAITNVKTTITNIINTIKTTWTSVWTGIKTTVTTIFSNIKSTITNVIDTIKNGISTALNNIKTNWSNAWTSVKTTVVNIFNSIWSGIKSIVNTILSGIETFVNGVIKGVNKVLSAINSITSAVGGLVGLSGTNLSINTISLPRLATGNVAYEETVGIFGEYSGASSNPEITAPQSIIYDTMVRALNDSSGDNDTPVNLELTVNVGNEKLGQILLEDLRKIKRRSGKDIEAIVG